MLAGDVLAAGVGLVVAGAVTGVPHQSGDGVLRRGDLPVQPPHLLPLDGGDPRQLRIHLAGAGGEVQLGRPGDAVADSRRVILLEPVAHSRPAAAVDRHASLRAVGAVDSNDGEMAVAGDPIDELQTGRPQPVGPERKRREGGLEEKPAIRPFVHVPALHHPLPTADLLAELRAHPAGGMDAQVAPDRAGPVGETLAQQQLGRSERPGREHDGARPHLVATVVP